jgi:hypothetical protein
MGPETLLPSSQVSTIRSYQEPKYNMTMVLNSNPVKSLYYLKNYLNIFFQTLLFLSTSINTARPSHTVDSIHALICLSKLHFFL